MELLQVVLYFAFFVCAALAAFKVPDGPRVTFGWLGICFFALALLLGGIIPIAHIGH